MKQKNYTFGLLLNGSFVWCQGKPKRELIEILQVYKHIASDLPVSAEGYSGGIIKYTNEEELISIWIFLDKDRVKDCDYNSNIISMTLFMVANI